MQAITERSEGDARSLRHNSSSGRTPDRSLPHDSSGKESNHSLLHGSSGKDSNHSLQPELSGKESTSSLQQIREGEPESNGAQEGEAAHGNGLPHNRSSMNSAIIDLLTTK